MTRTLKQGMKRGLAVVALAAALSTFGPLASSILVFSSGFGTQPSMRGGATVIYKNGSIPGWIAEIIPAPSTTTKSAMMRAMQADALSEDRS